MTTPIQIYKRELDNAIAFPTDGKNEKAYRTFLENYLKSIVNQEKLDVQVFQERVEKQENHWIIPDFACVSATQYSTVGYVETKDLDYNISSYIESEQVKKYQNICDNVLLTNYKEFIWVSTESTRRANIDNEEATNDLISAFLRQNPPKTRNVKQLAAQTAYYSRKLKNAILETLIKTQNRPKQSVIQAIYEEFQHGLVNLSISEFSDAFAQMTAFGFMIAKLNKPELTITLYNVRTAIPTSFSLIKELLKFVDDELLNLDENDEMRFYVSQIIGLMNAIDVPKIEKQLFVKVTETVNLLGEKHIKYTDPFIYFYEDYLGDFDPKLRKARGVYYTPMSIVQIIVKMIDNILINELNRPKGIAEPNVTALDFATGTGTFILEYATQTLSKFNPELYEKVIKERLLPNLNGFEYLAGAYTVAILKFSQFLKKNYNYKIQNTDKINIKLTNTLEDEQVKYNPLFPYFSEESDEANQIKEKGVLVIMGNPPYSIGSTNKSKRINLLMKDYKDGMGEKSMNALSDDYVKFIRFAHDKISKQEQGVIGIITNNSFLDGTVHRQMREKLLNDFDKIYIINLYGNAIKQDGDKNIFDIRVGVCITIMVKLPTRLPEKQIYYYSTKDNNIISRQQKTEFAENQFFKLSNFPIETALEWQKFTPKSPYFFFVPKNLDNHVDYQKFWAVTEIFEKYSSGIKSHRDKFLIDFDKNNLNNRIERFYQKDKEIIKKYDLENDIDIEKCIKKGRFNKTNTQNILYRPFDLRFIQYDTNLCERPRFEIMQHFFKENIGLVVSRKSRSSNSWKNALITENMISEGTTLSTLDTSYVFPLFLYKNSIGELGEVLIEQTPNFSKSFRDFIIEKYEILDPKQILGFIYANLYSPNYRKQFNEFLKIDFPRIPFPNNKEEFEKIALIGLELVNLHLLKKLPNTNLGNPKVTTGKVEKIYWQSNKLYIHPTQYFENISYEIFEYEIGGYKVLQKYLKEREGTELSLEEIEHIQAVINILNRTIEIQNMLATITATID